MTPLSVLILRAIPSSFTNSSRPAALQPLAFKQADGVGLGDTVEDPDLTLVEVAELDLTAAQLDFHPHHLRDGERIRQVLARLLALHLVVLAEVNLPSLQHGKLHALLGRRS